MAKKHSYEFTQKHPSSNKRSVIAWVYNFTKKEAKKKKKFFKNNGYTKVAFKRLQNE